MTGAGGDVLFVEVAMMDGDQGMTLTGQLGDVMKESAQIAMGYVRANGQRLGIPRRRARQAAGARALPGGRCSEGRAVGRSHHDHSPGVLLTGRLVRADVGMTGEVSLTGRVLPIGGVKQKLLAAHRAGLTDVILPERNGPDLDDVPADVLETITIIPTIDVAELVGLAMEDLVSAGSDTMVAA